MTNYKSNWCPSVYLKWYSARPGVISFELMLKLPMNILIFPMVNTFSCRNKLQDCSFLKVIIQWLLVFSWWAEQIFSKLFLGILQFSTDISVIFLKIKSKKSLNFCFYHHQVFPKPPKGNKKLQTRAIYHKGVCKPDKLFKTTATSTLNFHRCWIIKWTYVAKVGCPFHTYWMLPLNSKICSAKYFETQNQHLEYFLKKIIHRG